MTNIDTPKNLTRSRSETRRRGDLESMENNHPLYKAQVLTYLRLTNLKLGLLLNFGQQRLIDGLSRVINGL